MDPYWDDDPICAKCFPRRRGDGPVTGTGAAAFDMFPPQARGWTLEGVVYRAQVLVSPAGAGMDPVSDWVD